METDEQRRAHPKTRAGFSERPASQEFGGPDDLPATVVGRLQEGQRWSISGMKQRQCREEGPKPWQPRAQIRLMAS